MPAAKTVGNINFANTSRKPVLLYIGSSITDPLDSQSYAKYVFPVISGGVYYDNGDPDYKYNGVEYDVQIVGRPAMTTRDMIWHTNGAPQGDDFHVGMTKLNWLAPANIVVLEPGPNSWRGAGNENVTPEQVCIEHETLARMWTSTGAAVILVPPHSTNIDNNKGTGDDFKNAILEHFTAGGTGNERWRFIGLESFVDWRVQVGSLPTTLGDDGGHNDAMVYLDNIHLNDSSSGRGLMGAYVQPHIKAVSHALQTATPPLHPLNLLLVG